MTQTELRLSIGLMYACESPRKSLLGWLSPWIGLLVRCYQSARVVIVTEVPRIGLKSFPFWERAVNHFVIGPPSPAVYWNHRISGKNVENLRAAKGCGQN